MTARSTDRAKRADIYRKAAWFVEQEELHGGGYSCYAILRAEDPSAFYSAVHQTPALALYEKTFGHDARASGGYQQAWMLNAGPDYADIASCRVLALCFMAAMVEAGDA